MTAAVRYSLILNPELPTRFRPIIPPAGITDAIAHVMERYFTRTEHTDVVDRMSEAVMRGLMRSAKTGGYGSGKL